MYALGGNYYSETPQIISHPFSRAFVASNEIWPLLRCFNLALIQESRLTLVQIPELKNYVFNLHNLLPAHIIITRSYGIINLQKHPIVYWIGK